MILLLPGVLWTRHRGVIWYSKAILTQSLGHLILTSLELLVNLLSHLIGVRAMIGLLTRFGCLFGNLSRNLLVILGWSVQLASLGLDKLLLGWICILSILQLDKPFFDLLGMSLPQFADLDGLLLLLIPLLSLGFLPILDYQSLALLDLFVQSLYSRLVARLSQLFLKSFKLLLCLCQCFLLVL